MRIQAPEKEMKRMEIKNKTAFQLEQRSMSSIMHLLSNFGSTQ